MDLVSWRKEVISPSTVCLGNGNKRYDLSTNNEVTFYTPKRSGRKGIVILLLLIGYQNLPENGVNPVEITRVTTSLVFTCIH